MTASPAPKSDRVHVNRAPKGGAICPITGRWFKGGQFMPLAPEGFVAAPAKLEGSARQVAWATRLRAEALARLQDEIDVRRMMLADRKPVDAAGVRRAIRRHEAARHGLAAERSAASIIERRATFA